MTSIPQTATPIALGPGEGEALRFLGVLATVKAASAPCT
jgi:hypothetical protein